MEVVGIMLVRNEDLFLHRAASNIASFCDKILIAENGSKDGTWEIASQLARDFPHIAAHQIRDARESVEMLQPYAGTDTWVFGVDGDEIYDVGGLQTTRQVLEAGTWDDWWVIFGNVLNCVDLDPGAKKASGFLAPPCRSMTKLYHFGHITSVDHAATQRLLGHHTFAPGRSESRRFDLYKEITWEQAHFRCLHTCFLPRSSMDAQAVPRENITERGKLSARLWLRRIGAWLTGRQPTSSWKMEKYHRGPKVTVDASPFLP